MLIPQLYGRPFVDTLAREFGVAERSYVATAWVRASGVGLLWDSITGMLGRGGRLRIVVGIDRENTSREGLAMLLALEGDVRVYVRHNEATPIFHPKLYGFRTPNECRVFVGSNNLTGAGLSQNEELSALLVEEAGGRLERSLKAYIRQLRDPADDLAKRLDEDLLDQLVRAGYVDSEARLRGKAGNSGPARPAADRLFGVRQPIRRRIPARVPVPNPIDPRPETPVTDWNRVFVKLRLARGTQGQIPLAVAREVRRRLGENGLDGPFTVIDRHTRAERQISPTYPRRRPEAANTYKIEALPAQGHAILKLELVGRRVLAEFFDSAQADGQAVYEFLIDGLRSEPASTVDSNGAAARRAPEQTLEDATEGVTLYRFD
jgi:HKD family nuclease